MSSVERLEMPVPESDLAALADLLAGVVADGEAVSFTLPFTRERAEAWWERTLTELHVRSSVLVARHEERIVGTVTLHASWAPNQPHRGEIAKLLVHPEHRKQGFGDRLMEGAEEAAREADFTLLTLDAKRGEAAERLYRRRGWVHVGTIPDFAFDPDGVTPHDAVIYYKSLSA